MVSFTIEQPSWVSLDYLMNPLETIGGLVFSDYVASVTSMAANLSGNAALAAKFGIEGIISLLAFAGADRTSGETRDALFFASVGSAAALGMDVLNYAYGELFSGPGGKAAKATLGGSSSRVVTATQVSAGKKSESSESPV